jgi:hypothetical protein
VLANSGIFFGVIALVIREKSPALAVFGLITNVTAAALVPWFG